MLAARSNVHASTLHVPPQALIAALLGVCAACSDDGSSAAVQVLSAGDRDYIALANIAEGSSTLTADATGGLKPGLRMSGLPYGLIELE